MKQLLASYSQEQFINRSNHLITNNTHNTSTQFNIKILNNKDWLKITSLTTHHPTNHSHMKQYSIHPISKYSDYLLNTLHSLSISTSITQLKIIYYSIKILLWEVIMVWCINLILDSKKLLLKSIICRLLVQNKLHLRSAESYRSTVLPKQPVLQAAGHPSNSHLVSIS